MLNVSTFYKKNKDRFKSAFGTHITNLVYAEDKVFGDMAIAHIIQEITKAAWFNEFFANEAYKKIIFSFNHQNRFFTVLCTINNIYIRSANIEPIKLPDNCEAYIIPAEKYIKETVFLVHRYRVIAGGIIKNNTIIWNRKIRLSKYCFMYIDLEKHPEIYTDEIISNVVLNDLKH